MGGGLSKVAKQELLATIRDRYRESYKKEKSRILDEFIAVTGHHRRHAIKLLGQLGDGEDAPRPARGRRIYDAAVREAVIVIREAADRKRHPKREDSTTRPGSRHRNGGNTNVNTGAGDGTPPRKRTSAGTVPNLPFQHRPGAINALRSTELVTGKSGM